MKIKWFVICALLCIAALNGCTGTNQLAGWVIRVGMARSFFIDPVRDN